jgi:hypothetical protein
MQGQIRKFYDRIFSVDRSLISVPGNLRPKLRNGGRVVVTLPSYLRLVLLSLVITYSPPQVGTWKGRIFWYQVACNNICFKIKNQFFEQDSNTYCMSEC